MPVNKLIADQIIAFRLKALQSPIISAALLGSTTCFAFAPFFFLPVLFAIYITLIYLIKYTDSTDTAFFMGCAFFSGVISTNFFWGIKLAALYFESIWPDAWIQSYGIAFLALILFFVPSILLYGVSFVAVKKAYRRLPAILLPWGIALIFLGAESLIGLPYKHGFPWYASGYSVAHSLHLIQIAAIGGTSLLSFLVIGTAATFAIYSPKQHILTASIASLCFAIGAYRLPANTATANTETIELKLVQAAIPAAQNTYESGKLKGFLLYEILSQDEEDAPNRLTIWAEMSVPFFLKESPAQLAHLQDLAQPEILVGALRRIPRREVGALQSRDHIYNVSALIGQDGDIQYASKNILVPYGEYLPFEEKSTAFYKKYLPGRISFTPGNQIDVLESKVAGKLGVLNCYEVLFSTYTAQLAQRSDILLSISNDAWISGTWAEHQILYIARLRAVETGRHLVRVANKGIHAVIDGYGRFLFQENSDEPTVKDISVPKRAPQDTLWVTLNALRRTVVP